MGMQRLRKWLRLAGRKKARPGPKGFSPRLERLEDRTTPAAVFWDGGGDALNWGDRLNWNNDVLPTAVDDVTINVAGDVTVQIATFVNATVNSLASEEAIRVAGGTLSVATDSAVNAAFALQGGNVSGAGTLTIDGPLTWTSGSMSGTGKTVLNGASTLSGGFFSRLDGRMVDNFGAAAITTGNSITISGAGVWNNKPGGTFTLEGTGSVGAFFVSSPFAFNNEGTLRKTGAGSANLGVVAANTGTVEVQEGTLTLRGNSSGAFDLSAGAVLNVGGGYVLDAGAVVTGAGTLQVSTFNGLTVNGPTTIENLTLAGGSVTANAALTVTNLTQNGTVTGGGDVTINGQWTWTNGNTSGTGKTIVSDTATGALSGGFFSRLEGRDVDNFGTVSTALNNGITFRDAVQWSNKPGSVFVLQGTGSIGNFFAGAATFTNEGTIRKTGPGAASIGVPVTNTGTVEVQEGTLTLSGSSSGTFDLSSGAILNVGGAYVLNDGAEAISAGAVQVGTFSSLTVNGAAAIANLNISGGTVTGGGDLTINGQWTWTRGTMRGTGKTIVSDTATATLSGGFFSMLDGRTVDNFGTVSTALNNGITFRNAAQWNNKPSGVFILQGTGSIGNFFAGAAQFTNEGTIRKTGPGAAGIGVRLVNPGTIEVQEGTLDLGGNLTNFSANTLTGGTYVVQGTLKFSNADIRINAAAIVLDGPSSAIVNRFNGNGLANFATNAAAGSFTITNGRNFTAPAPFANAGTVVVGDGSTFSTPGDYTQSAGLTLIESGGALSANTTVFINGGTLGGNGAVNADVVNGGTVAPGTSPGSLTINGDYTQTATGTFFVELAGLTPGSEHDRLVVTGAATLAGTLKTRALGGYLPDFGDVFRVMTFASRGGDFTTFDGLDLGTYRLLVPTFSTDGTALDLVTISSNDPPVIDAIDDITVHEGTPVSFTVTAVNEEVNETLTFTLEPGAPAGAQIDPLTGLFTFDAADGPGTFTITVRVTDNGLPNLSDTETFTITVANLAPSLTISAPAGGVRGQTRIFNLTVADPSPVDQAAGFTYSVQWGDGDSETLSGSGSLSLEHVYTDNGSYVVEVTVTDKDGAATTQTHTIEIVTAQLQGDTLAVGGTTGGDVIVLARNGRFADSLRLIFPGEGIFTFSGVGRVLVFGQDGNDVVTTGSVSVPTEVYGGGGNDVLTAGSGDDILDGGAGNDVLTGGSGRDILIGGDGTDVIVGGADDDILIAARFLDDSPFSERQAALHSARQEWTSETPYAERVAALDALFTSAVADDGDLDVLVGSSGDDWYFARLSGVGADILGGIDEDEIVNDLP